MRTQTERNPLCIAQDIDPQVALEGPALEGGRLRLVIDIGALLGHGTVSNGSTPLGIIFVNIPPPQNASRALDMMITDVAR